MLDFTAFQLHTYLAAYLWPFVRILAWLAADPVMGNRNVPAQVKIGLAFVLSIVVTPLIGPPPAIDPGSYAGLLILAEQILIGVAMGMAMQVIFMAVQTAGALIGLQMGLGFASFFDPSQATEVPILGEFLSIVATLVFLAVNGHLMVIDALVSSFQTLPPGVVMPLASIKLLLTWGGQIFVFAVHLSLPVVIALLIINLAIGIVSRAAPQMNLFVVGFPITMAAGFGFLALSLPYFLPLLEHMYADGIKFLPLLLHRGAG